MKDFNNLSEEEDLRFTESAKPFWLSEAGGVTSLTDFSNKRTPGHIIGISSNVSSKDMQDWQLNKIIK